MNSVVINKLKNTFGARATDDAFECHLYSRDLAPVPEILTAPLIKTKPDIVLRPQSTEEIAGIMKLAWQERIPVTPRAGGSTVYFNSVPVRGGILLDLNLLKGIVGLNESQMTVRVRASTTWQELETYLNQHELAPRSVPSSAPVATVAGWLNMMGYGIGSIKYGSLASQIESMEVVLPNGEVKRISQTSSPSVDWFAASEGTLGIVTELELKVRPNRGMCHFPISLDKNADLSGLVQTVIDADISPYNLHFNDQRTVDAYRTLGLSDLEDSGFLIGIDYENSSEELDRIPFMIQEIVRSFPGTKLLTEKAGEKEWRERYKALRLKRGGPSMLGAEVWLPVKSLRAYLKDMEKMGRRYKLNHFSYGHVITQDAVSVMTMFYNDETRTLDYILGLGLVKKIHEIGDRFGGYPYGTGFWNTPYIWKIHSREERRELANRKKKLDSRGILNPGKVYRFPFILNPFNFWLGTNTFALAYRLLGGGRQR